MQTTSVFFLTFSKGRFIGETVSQPYCVTTDDVNGDDELDINIFNYGVNSVGVFLKTVYHPAVRDHSYLF